MAKLASVDLPHLCGGESSMFARRIKASAVGPGQSGPAALPEKNRPQAATSSQIELQPVPSAPLPRKSRSQRRVPRGLSTDAEALAWLVESRSEGISTSCTAPDLDADLRARLRVLCGLRNYRDIGRATGVNAESVRRYLTANVTIPAAFVSRVCDLTGGSPEWALHGTGLPFCDTTALQATIAQIAIAIDDLRRARRALLATRLARGSAHAPETEGKSESKSEGKPDSPREQ